MRSRLVAAVLACVAVAGCGSNPEEPKGPQGPGVSPQMIPAQDTARVIQASEAITLHCRRPPRQALRTLIEVYRSNPDGIIDSGRLIADKSMTRVLHIKAEQLRRCGNKRDAATLERALKSGT